MKSLNEKTVSKGKKVQLQQKTILIGFIIIAVAIIISTLILSTNKTTTPTTTTTITTTTTEIKQLTKFVVNAYCDETLDRLSLSIKNNVGEPIILATIQTYSEGIVPPEGSSIDPYDYILEGSEKTYGNIPSSCPNSIYLELGYIDSVGSHKDIGIIDVG